MGGIGIYLMDELSFDPKTSKASIWLSGDKTQLDRVSAFDFKTVTIYRAGQAEPEVYRKGSEFMMWSKSSADKFHPVIYLW